jgi:hypothetical protein
VTDLRRHCPVRADDIAEFPTAAVLGSLDSADRYIAVSSASTRTTDSAPEVVADPGMLCAWQLEQQPPHLADMLDDCHAFRVNSWMTFSWLVALHEVDRSRPRPMLGHRPGPLSGIAANPAGEPGA